MGLDLEVDTNTKPETSLLWCPGWRPQRFALSVLSGKTGPNLEVTDTEYLDAQGISVLACRRGGRQEEVEDEVCQAVRAKANGPWREPWDWTFYICQARSAKAHGVSRVE